MDEFVNKIKTLLESEGIEWQDIEHRVLKIDNNTQTGEIIFTYQVRIPYIPHFKPGLQ